MMRPTDRETYNGAIDKHEPYEMEGCHHRQLVVPGSLNRRHCFVDGKFYKRLKGVNISLVVLFQLGLEYVTFQLRFDNFFLLIFFYYVRRDN